MLMCKSNEIGIETITNLLQIYFLCSFVHNCLFGIQILFEELSWSRTQISHGQGKL